MGLTQPGSGKSVYHCAVFCLFCALLQRLHCGVYNQLLLSHTDDFPSFFFFLGRLMTAAATTLHYELADCVSGPDRLSSGLGSFMLLGSIS